MNKYNAGDKFILEIGECYERGLPFGDDNTPNELYRIKGFNSLVFDDNGLDKLQKYTEAQIPYSEAYNQGLQDAWKLADRLNNMAMQDVIDIYGFILNRSDVFDVISPQEALAKIEAYEKSQQIKVGDVVEVKSVAGSKYIGVVTQITANQNVACIVYSDGSIEMTTDNNMKKTGKHIEIQQILDSIGTN